MFLLLSSHHHHTIFLQQSIPVFCNFRGNQLSQKLLFSFAKQTKSSKIWMHEHVNDEFVKKAQKDNYRSRSTYKLIEIQEKYKIFKEGYKVLELGSAPGGWTQASVQFTKSSDKNPSVLAIDRDSMHQVSGAQFIQGDITDIKTQMQISEFFNQSLVDVVLSDMAPNFSGDLETDHLQILELNNMAIDVCTVNLRIGGTLVMKMLSGATEKDVFKMYKIYFRDLLRVKPKASRSRSTELYYLGKGYGQSKEYEQLRRIEEKKDRGQNVENEDVPNLGFTDEELIQKSKTVISQMYYQSKIRKRITQQKNQENQEKQTSQKDIAQQETEKQKVLDKVADNSKKNEKQNLLKSESKPNHNNPSSPFSSNPLKLETNQSNDNEK